MRTFLSRRRKAIVLTILAGTAISLLIWAWSLRLATSSFLSGWILFGIMLVLTSYNLRKKLPFLPLLKSSTWLQIHLYLGFLTILIFLQHTGFKIPNGGLEVTLAVLYWLVAGSGVIGLFLTRTLPGRLSVRGEELLFERMPVYRRNIHEEAEKLVVVAVDEAGTTTLADYYKRRLAAYFNGFRNFWHHLIESKRPRHNFETELSDLDRYLNDREREIAAELQELVFIKDDLDYQHALQKTLKGWLFIHIAFTYSLMIVAVVHVVIVHAFHGGL
ncbi:MAG: hypothetical protein WD768_19320 [Phycisphaeraceae bacterium]